MKKKSVVLIHLIFWIVIVIIPFSMMSMRDFKFEATSYYFLVQNILNFLLFYLTYLVLIPFLVKRRSIGPVILYSIVFIILLTYLRFLVSPYFREYFGVFQRFPPNTLYRVFFAFNWTILFTVYPGILYLSIEWFKERQAKIELMKEIQQSEIDLLKSQVNPHFLMNTLNNLYSLVYQGSKQSSEAVLKLSDLMRYMLYDTQDEYVSLENEIKYLQSFIELQLLRFSNKDFISFEIVGDPSGKVVAPMLLIPFVENAFKHGDKTVKESGIKISMNIRDDSVIFEVMNIKSGRSVSKISESGIGLNNIKKRLELQYPERHNLSITDGTDSFNARLTLFI